MKLRVEVKLVGAVFYIICEFFKLIIGALELFRNALERGKILRKLLGVFYDGFKLVQSTAAAVVAVKGGNRSGNKLHNIFGAFYTLAESKQLVLLAVFDCGGLYLAYLIFKQIYSRFLVGIIHAYFLYGAFGFFHGLVAFTVCKKLRLGVAESVYVAYMKLRILQNYAVMLTVYVNKRTGKLLECAYRCGTRIYLAYILTLGGNFTGNHKLIFLRVIAELCKSGFYLLRNIGKNRGNKRLAFAGAHKVAAGSAAEDSIDGVDKYGFTCAGFAGKDVKSVLEINGRAFDYRYVLYKKLGKHR